MLILIYVIISFCLIFSFVLSSKREIVYFDFCAISIAIILMLIGISFKNPYAWPDSLTYLNAFYTNEWRNFEYLFSLFNSWLFEFNSNGSFYFFTFGLISIFFLSLVIFSLPKREGLFVIFLYFSHIYFYRDLIQIRAGIAYNIILYFYYLESSKNKMINVSWIFLSFLFHKTAIFSLCTKFFRDIKITDLFMYGLCGFPSWFIDYLLYN